MQLQIENILSVFYLISEPHTEKRISQTYDEKK